MIVDDRVCVYRDHGHDRAYVCHAHFGCSVLDFLSVTSNVTGAIYATFYCFCGVYCDHAIANDLGIEIVPFLTFAKMALLLLISGNAS